MTEKFQLYKCSVCGNLVEVLLSGVGVLVCCGKEMELIRPKNSKDDDGLSEKHSPVIDNVNKTISVTKHPMIDEHYIMFLEYFSKDNTEAKIKYFHPGEVAIMKTDIEDDELSARSYCNIHGLYTDEKKEK